MRPIIVPTAGGDKTTAPPSWGLRCRAASSGRLLFMREGTGISVGVAGAITAFFVALAGLLVATTYLLVCVYAIVKLVGDREGHPDPATIIVGFVLLTTLLVAGLLVGLRFLGRSLSSRARADAS